MVREGTGWRKTMTETAYSALVAHRHVCQTDDIDLENTRLLMDDSFRYEINNKTFIQNIQPINNGLRSGPTQPRKTSIMLVGKYRRRSGIPGLIREAP